NSARHDELGQLARTFDEMASQIHTLVENERNLLRDISHELRSPLTRLGLAVELARSHPDKEEALNRIEREADRLNVLVSDLLSLARIENQQSIRWRQPLQLDDLLKDIIDACSVEASQHQCNLVLRAVTPITIEADEELIRRAMENPIRNAIRYAPTHTEVIVTAEQANAITIVRIRDFGPGIPQEMLSRVFDPFCRADRDRSRETGGIGL